MIPLLKWPGGKRWFVFHHRNLLPPSYGRYIEPFFGGGSVFFHLEPTQAILGDTNAELIAVYRAIKRCRKRVEAFLLEHHRQHNSRHYYHVRDTIPDDPIERAARTIYLNRTCFNGIYRVNLAGTFNVPIGTKTSVILDTDDFAAAARLFKTAEFHVSDFQHLIDGARRNDLVFADPPYTVAHNNNGFVKYNETLFKWDDQIRLADTLAQARDRGVKIVATNADHLSVRDLYIQRGFECRTIERHSCISGSTASRHRFQEIVIVANCSGESECHPRRPISNPSPKKPVTRGTRSRH